jgi:branched-chain amino acid transport system ATP-binding protein
VLRTENISVSFGGIRAIDGVGFDVDAGRVTGLIGPNGAGKTTMFNVVTGLQKPKAGRVFLNEIDVTRMGPKSRARMGMGRTFQRLEVFGSLSVRENVMVALESRRGRSTWRGHRAQADELLRRVGIADYADAAGDVLSTGTARLLEMARALACGPKVLLLDEVSAGLDSHESILVGEIMLELAKEGIAVLLVEHDMDLVMRVCEQLYVMDFGQLIAAGKPEDIRADPKVQAAYLGTEILGTGDEVRTTEGLDS